MPNIDLTTLPGWSSLSSGSHSITIVARAAGYQDSEPSESVMVTKESTVYNLTLPEIWEGADEVISPSGMALYTTNNNANIIQVSEKTYNAVTSYNDEEVLSSIQQFANAYNVVLPDTIEGLTGVGYRVTFADGTPIEEQPIELRIETTQGLEAVTVLRLNWKTDELEVLDITVDNSDISGKITINTGSDYLLAFCLKNEDPLATTDFITFTGESSDFTLAVGSDGAKEWDGTVEYSTDHENWTEWDGSAVSSVDKKLYLRGSGNTTFFTDLGAKLSLSARAACSGNIQALLEYSNPPTTLADYCYASMFCDCTNLTAAPELPATTLADDCYDSMFSGCTSLTTAPALPATTLADYCYYSMFSGCTSLTTAPALPATTLRAGCYSYMFYGCTSLKISSTQSTEYPTAWRIPSSGTISSTAANWNNNMLAGTGGTIQSGPSINTTYYGAWTK